MFNATPRRNILLHFLIYWISAQMLGIYPNTNPWCNILLRIYILVNLSTICLIPCTRRLILRNTNLDTKCYLRKTLGGYQISLCDCFWLIFGFMSRKKNDPVSFRVQLFTHLKISNPKIEPRPRMKIKKITKSGFRAKNTREEALIKPKYYFQKLLSSEIHV